MLLRFASHFLEERCEGSGCWRFILMRLILTIAMEWFQESNEFDYGIQERFRS